MKLWGKAIVAAAIALALLAGYRVGVWRQKEASRRPVVDGKYMRPYFAELKIPSQADNHSGRFWRDVVKGYFDMLDYNHPENNNGWQFRLHSSRSIARHPMNRSSNQAFTGVVDGYYGQNPRHLTDDPDAVFYFSNDRLTEVVLRFAITLVLVDGHIRQMILTEGLFGPVSEMLLFNPQGRIVYYGDYRKQAFNLFNSEKYVDGLMRAEWLSPDARHVAYIEQYQNGNLHRIDYMGQDNVNYSRSFDPQGKLIDTQHVLQPVEPHKGK